MKVNADFMVNILFKTLVWKSLRHLGKAVATRTLSTLLKHTMRRGKQDDARSAWQITLSLSGKKSGCASLLQKLSVRL